MSRSVFVSSRVSTRRHRRLNLKIADRCRALGLAPFLPQLELDDVDDPVVILEGNETAVVRAALVVVVFDTAGAGVAMELGQALALGKPVIGFRSGRSRRRESLGMMLEGAWQRLPAGRRATGLRELERALTRWVGPERAPRDA